MNVLTASIQELIDYQKQIRKEADDLIVDGLVSDTQKYKDLILQIQYLEDEISSKICDVRK